MQIREILNTIVDNYNQKPALIFKENVVTFSQLQENVLRLANVLLSQGVRKGDKVALYLPNCPEYAYGYLAIFHLGAVGVPLDFMLKEDELLSCLNHSETKALLAMPRQGLDLVAIRSKVPSLKQIIVIDEQVPGEHIQNYATLMAQASVTLESPDIDLSDPALIMYTSGTTGQPKGILLSYKHLEGSPQAMKYFVDLTDCDVKLAAIPLSHIGGFIYIQNCIHFGITVVLMERFNPFEFLQLVEEHKVTCFHIVPPMYNAILTLKHIERFDLSSLRWVVVFGAPSSPEILQRFHQYCPNARLLNGWGMTETCPPNTVTPMNSDNIKSIGKPAPHCEIRIFDDHGKEVAVGEIGEIAIRGWIVMQEYYKDPEATAGMKREGWLYTGDLGQVDKDGFFYIVGRKKEMIKVAGQIVYEPEVEAAFYKHDSVAEVAVIGIPDKMKGEVVKAMVVFKEGADITVDDLRAFIRNHLANYKVPRVIEICDVLPKNRTGKIDKQQLKAKQEQLT